MDNTELNIKKKKIKGFEEQDILIEELSHAISRASRETESSIRIHVTEGLYDALEKRHIPFKKTKALTVEEKQKFINDIVINTIKRAKLVVWTDKILEESNRAYNDWKIIYRPNELE